MIIKKILNRRAVREYKPDDVSDEQIIEIIKAGQFAPTARGNKAVEFIVIRNQDIKNEIFEIVNKVPNVIN
jgi:nitroreductase